MATRRARSASVRGSVAAGGGNTKLEDNEADCDAKSGAEDDADQEDRDCPRTLEELSTEFGVSRERVRQIEVRAFEKVQGAVRKNLAAHASCLGARAAKGSSSAKKAFGPPLPFHGHAEGL